VVGYSNTSDNVSHATLWNGTTIIDLNSFLSASDVSAGWVLTNAFGINDQGWIVGVAENTLTGLPARQEYVGFVLATVPEPETLLLLLTALAAMGVASRRKAKQA